MKADEINLLKKASQETRGAFLEAATEFEWVIELYVANYFFGPLEDDKFQDFMSLIIKPHITFRNKVETFKIILEKKNPEFLETHKSLPNDFQKILYNRNVFAHDPLHTSSLGLKQFSEDNKVGYYKFKAKKNKEDNTKIDLHSVTEYTDKSVSALIILIESYSSEILFLMD